MQFDYEKLYQELVQKNKIKIENVYIINGVKINVELFKDDDTFVYVKVAEHCNLDLKYKFTINNLHDFIEFINIVLHNIYNAKECQHCLTLIANKDNKCFNCNLLCSIANNMFKKCVFCETTNHPILYICCLSQKVCSMCIKKSNCFQCTLCQKKIHTKFIFPTFFPF